MSLTLPPGEAVTHDSRSFGLAPASCPGSAASPRLVHRRSASAPFVAGCFSVAAMAASVTLCPVPVTWWCPPSVTHALQHTGSSVPGVFRARALERVALPIPGSAIIFVYKVHVVLFYEGY